MCIRQKAREKGNWKDKLKTLNIKSLHYRPFKKNVN